MTQVIIFAGTTEGRILGEILSSNGVTVVMCVATEYSLHLIKQNKNLTIISKRLDADHIEKLITDEECGVIVDATHPYAEEISKNIRLATANISTQYIRLVRHMTICNNDKYLYMDCVEKAAEYLETNPMKTLLTIGSKSLHHFVEVPKFTENIFVRVLPFPEVVQKCNDMGFFGRQLICMQGPFTHELNVAMIKSFGIECIVTKDSGDIGGTNDKLSAVDETGIKAIVISRPYDEIGLSLSDTKKLLSIRFGIDI